jgi:hypothetical protein
MEHLKESIRNGLKTVEILAQSEDYQAASKAEYELMVWVLNILDTGKFDGHNLTFHDVNAIINLLCCVLDVDFPRSFE